MSAIKIDKKIAKYRVQKAEDKAAAEAAAGAAARGHRGAAASQVRARRRNDARQAGPLLEGRAHDRRGAAPRDARGLHLQDQDAGVRSRHVRDHQRHHPQRRHAVRAAPAVRDLHQLEEPRSLPVDRGADAHHLRGVPQGRRRHVPGRRAEGRVRSARGLLAGGRQVHAVDHRRAGLCHREAPADHRSAQEAGAR